MISRFNFNISIIQTFINLFKLACYAKKDNRDSLEKKLLNYYPNSNFYFFDHGRTALFETLNQIKRKSKKRKILVNSMTLFEVINVIIYAGFEPVFLDNSKNSFETDLDINKAQLDKKDIAAIIITHLNGFNKNIFSVKKQLIDHNEKNDYIYLIEDCAVSLGAKSNNTYTGSIGDFSFLSFNIMKNITCYTGGVLIDNKKGISSITSGKYLNQNRLNIIKKIIFVLIIQILNSRLLFPIFFKFIRFSHKNSFNFFLKKYRTDFVVSIEEEMPKKFLYLLHPFQIDILIPQFSNLEKNQLIRMQNSKYYYENLKHLDELKFPQIEFTQENIFIDFPIICSTKQIKQDLFNHLLNKNIDVKNYYYKNCSEENIYFKYENNCINAKSISDNIIMLPVHKKVTLDLKDSIILKINNFFKEGN